METNTQDIEVENTLRRPQKLMTETISETQDAEHLVSDDFADMPIIDMEVYLQAVRENQNITKAEDLSEAVL